MKQMDISLEPWNSISCINKEKRCLSRGILVVFEGIDGAGKTTQALLLKALLEHERFEVHLFKEPTNSKWGLMIKKISKQLLRDTSNSSINWEAELFLRDRKYNVKHNIIPRLRDRAIVILDRYYYSSIAYQGGLGHIAPELIKEKNEQFAPRPDAVFILDIPPYIAIERIREALKGSRSKISSFESERNLTIVRDVYLSLSDSNIRIIDGTQTRGAILDIIYSHLVNIIKELEVR